MQKTIIVIGAVIVLIGILWPWIGAIPFGRLPGDIVIERENFKLYFPITTMVLISLVVSILIWLFRQ